MFTPNSIFHIVSHLSDHLDEALSIVQKQCGQIKKTEALTEGGEGVGGRYEHAHRFNVFLGPFPYKNLRLMLGLIC